MWEELENALAWYAAAPVRWTQSAKQDLSAAAEWIWEVLQGDFYDDQTTAQIATGTVISMIPFVDQLCDVRDVVANCRKINEDSSAKAAWLALALTLIGLFPVLGSLVKGCLKILFRYARKGLLTGAVKFADSGLWQATQPLVDASIAKLNVHLDHPAVRKTLSALQIDNVYTLLATEIRTLKGTLTAHQLTGAFDLVIETLQDFTELMNRWGSTALQSNVGQVLRTVKNVRDQANAKLGEILKPLQNWLDALAKRLELEADMQYRAYTNAINPHGFTRTKLEVELDAFRRERPEWVDGVVKLKYRPMEKPPAAPTGWFTLAPVGESPLSEVFRTFHDAVPKEYLPGTVLYRIVDPRSGDNAICWMSREEFEKLTSKSVWRRCFAVWRHWNGNGEYVTYTVPPGPPLRGWEGVTASQALKNANDEVEFTLEGGAIQIVLNPDDLKPLGIGARKPTQWGYGDATHKPDLTGVPVLTHNWYGPN